MLVNRQLDLSLLQGEIPKIVPPKILTVQPHTQDWSVSPPDRLKYDQLFDTLLPVDGLLPGNKVRSVLMDSKLPLEALSKIWDLADQDKDGSLDKHEFLVVSSANHGREGQVRLDLHSDKN